MQEPTNIFTSLLFFADFVEDSLEPFITMMIFMGMIIALMLPIIAIPYIFIKLGSVAAKIQAAGNKAVRNTAMGRNAAGKAARGAAGRGWDNKSAKWAARNDGSMRSKVGGYKTQRDFRRAENKKAAERLQEEAIHSRIAGDTRYARRAAGVGGAAGVQRLQYGAEAAVERREQEERKLAAESMVRQGIESDRGALQARVRAATTTAEVQAGTDLLLKTGGTEEYKGLLEDQALMSRANGEHGRAVIAAGRANYGTVDSKSRDVADFMARQDAAQVAATGNATNEIRVETRGSVMKLGSKKLIKLEPGVLERTKAEALKIQAELADPTISAVDKTKALALLQTHVNQAAQALTDVDFGDAKTATQQHLKDIAAGKFT